MESIDALANAVNDFKGGLVLVSHDMRLISQVAKEIWICDDKSVKPYKGDIQNFKMDMRAQMGIEGEQKSQLRGDASVVKTKEEKKSAPPKKAAAPKLTVVAPPKPAAPAAPPRATAFETGGMAKSLPAALPVAPKPVAPKPAAAAPVPAAASGDAPPARSRYIPPHLRKKMQG
jgi:ATP-binding cassette subfamily F protein 2